MKTHFLPAIITIFLYTSTAHAQTSWQITGNSNITTSNFIGTTNKQPFILKTNNIERLRILSNGYIGIGTKTPDNTFHIFKGSAGKVTGYPLAPLVVENSTACYINLLAPDNTETGIFFGKPKSNISGSIIYSHFVLPDGLEFRTGGNNIRMVIDSNGHVGINTLTPDNMFSLTVKSFADPGSMGIYGSGGYIGIFGSGNGQGVHGEGVNGVLGVSINDAGYAGYFVGDVYSEGGTYQGSDERLKQNIRDFSSALNIINQLKPKLYEFRQEGNYKLMNLPQGSHYGLIAQDVEKVLPRLVKDSKFETRMAHLDPKEAGTKSETIEFKALNYTELIPVLIKAIQEQQQYVEKQQQQTENQQQQIEKQQQEIDELKKMINKLSSASQSSSLSISEAFLQQNAPNPASKNTVVRCYIPSSVEAAQLVIYNANGTQLKSFTVKNGINEININTGLLPAGEYSYSLTPDGNKVDSKKMVILK